ncbi:MAG: biotin carboxylase N-terminal domain-containing protein [Acidimicrobiales bacterium]
MPLVKVLVANRGEIACRVLRACAEIGIDSVAVYSADDATCAHVGLGGEAVALDGRGAAAYLDATAIIEAAIATNCDAIHPGYGFLSERGDFAAACADAGLTFVGPTPDALNRFGDKATALALAQACGVPILASSGVVTTVEAAAAFQSSLGPDASVMLKAIGGGGGRGMRIVGPGDDLAAAFARCQSEALSAFGNGELYVEQLLEGARHVEVQLIADSNGSVRHLWERDCSLQRQQQKIVEYAPAPGLPESTQGALVADAVKIGQAGGGSS